MKLIYLSTPYTSQYPTTEQLRYEQSLKLQSAIFSLAYRDSQGACKDPRFTVFNPLAHTVPLVKLTPSALLRKYSYWMPHDLELVRRSDALIVYQLPGWKESRGVNWEVQEADMNNIPVYYAVGYDDPYIAFDAEQVQNIIEDICEQ